MNNAINQKRKACNRNFFITKCAVPSFPSSKFINTHYIKPLKVEVLKVFTL